MLNYGWGALGGGRPLLDILTVPGEFKPLYLLLLDELVVDQKLSHYGYFSFFQISQSLQP